MAQVMERTTDVKDSATLAIEIHDSVGEKVRDVEIPDPRVYFVEIFNECPVNQQRGWTAVVNGRTARTEDPPKVAYSVLLVDRDGKAEEVHQVSGMDGAAAFVEEWQRDPTGFVSLLVPTSGIGQLPFEVDRMEGGASHE